MDSFFGALQRFGYAVITKPVSYFKVSLIAILTRDRNRRWLEACVPGLRTQLMEEAARLDAAGIKLLEPKANFDIEIATDALDTHDEYDTFVLFSGDGDFAPLVEKLREKGKRVITVAGRKMFSGQLKNASDVSLSLETFADELPGLITIRKPKPAHKGRVLKKCSVSIASVKRLSSLFTPPVDKSCALHVTSEIQRRRWVPVRELSEGQEIAIMTSELNVQDDGKQFGLDQALVFEEIVSIENTGVQHTYDIEVEGTHNFVAGHLINTKTGEPLTPEEEDKVLNENGHDVENMKFNNWLVPSEYTTTEDGIVFGGIVAHNTAFFNQASTTLFSANQAWFGGTATSSFSSAGALTLITPLLVGSGGTGASTLTGLLQGNGTSAITGITDSSTAGQVLRVTGASTYAWGALDLSDTDAITGDLPFANLAQVSANSILGNITGATADATSIATSSLFTWTGTGDVVRATSPTLITPALGTPSALVLTNATGLPVAGGGTGASTLTGLLQGNGTSAITGITGTAGQFPYYNGTNTLLATSTLFVSTASNVGIGTATPGDLSSKLQILGANSADPSTLLVTNSNWAAGRVGSAVAIGQGAGTGNTYSSIQALITGGTVAGNLVFNPVGGNVGVGTTSPFATLSVQGATGPAKAFAVYGGTGASGGQGTVGGNIQLVGGIGGFSSASIGGDGGAVSIFGGRAGSSGIVSGNFACNVNISGGIANQGSRSEER